MEMSPLPHLEGLFFLLLVNTISSLALETLANLRNLSSDEILASDWNNLGFLQLLVVLTLAGREAAYEERSGQPDNPVQLE